MIDYEMLQNFVREGDIYKNLDDLCAKLQIIPKNKEEILENLQQWCDLKIKKGEITIQKINRIPRTISIEGTGFCIPTKYEHRGGIFLIVNPDGTKFVGYSVDLKARYDRIKYDKRRFKPNGRFELLELVNDDWEIHSRAEYYIKLFSSEITNIAGLDNIIVPVILSQQQIKDMLIPGTVYQNAKELFSYLHIAYKEKTKNEVLDYLSILCELQIEDERITIGRKHNNTFTIHKYYLPQFVGMRSDETALIQQLEKLSEIYNWVMNKEGYITCEYATEHKCEISRFAMHLKNKDTIFITNNWDWISNREEFPIDWYLNNNIDFTLEFLNAVNIIDKEKYSWWEDLKSGKLTIAAPDLRIDNFTPYIYLRYVHEYPDNYKFKYIKGMLCHEMEIYNDKGEFIKSVR